MQALVKAGYEVISAGDGEAGLHSAQQNIPDLILLDMLCQN
jgi:DNA-binding response OmpR family regulator